MPSISLIAAVLLTFCTLVLPSSTSQINHNRRILHQPFFPLDYSPPPLPSPSPTHPPLPSPKQEPKYPFTAESPPLSFFPIYTLPPPPPPPSTDLSTFPANISSLILPQSPSSSQPISRKLVAVVISVSLFSAALITSLGAFLFYHRKHQHHAFFSDKAASRADSLRLFPPNTVASDGGLKLPPSLRNPSSTSSEFLYLGTLVNSRGDTGDNVHKATNASNTGGSSVSGYQRLSSPELRPLPPLPRHNFRQNQKNGSDCYEEEFFSPIESSPGKNSPNGTGNFGSRSLNSRIVSYPSSISASPIDSLSQNSSVPLNLSPRILISKSPDSFVNFPAPSRPIPPPPPQESLPISQSHPSSQPEKNSEYTRNPMEKMPIAEPPVLVAPSRSVTFQVPATIVHPQNMQSVERNEEIRKPKLKPLHWDKVRASSDRAMVWDQLKTSSFQLNEEMIETLFTVKSSNLAPEDNTRGGPHVLSSLNQENQVLDPKKSQNIAILLRALNVTTDEVCEALIQGNADTLGAELLESILKMAPTKEEEYKLKEFKDESSPFKLGPGEKFLKAVLSIPFAFKRVDAMLYMVNFNSEVEYLKRSFEIWKAACEELRNSRMFLKLLEAVLKTGNRMNDGTNRGDAHAFKLDTLLKLVDVKGTDGKTTLLHFVVQEIIKAEGCRLSGDYLNQTAESNQQSAFRDDVEFRKLGLQVVSGLSGELCSVKKAAAMDSDVLSNEVIKLVSGVMKIREFVKLNEEVALKGNTRKFCECLIGFLKTAEEEIVKIHAQESIATSMVKEITEYFHGKEEARPFQIFMVVRDFLSVLDHVCKEVGKINERAIVS